MGEERAAETSSRRSRVLLTPSTASRIPAHFPGRCQKNSSNHFLTPLRSTQSVFLRLSRLRSSLLALLLLPLFPSTPRRIGSNCSNTSVLRGRKACKVRWSPKLERRLSAIGLQASVSLMVALLEVWCLQPLPTTPLLRAEQTFHGLLAVPSECGARVSGILLLLLSSSCF